MLKVFFWKIEDILWNIKCHYNFWLHGPYGLTKEIEKMPFRYIIKYLKKYGATIGQHCRIERGIILHRPDPVKPFKNLILDDYVFIGHKCLIDLTEKIILHKYAGMASFCQLWTHQTTTFVPPCPENRGQIVLEEDTVVYSGSILSHGVTIGKNSRVGANSLVNKSVKPFTFVAGSPAIERNTGTNNKSEPKYNEK